LLALLPLFATQGKQALARDRSKTEDEIRRQDNKASTSISQPKVRWKLR
jgi:hypothetical protein